MSRVNISINPENTDWMFIIGRPWKHFFWGGPPTTSKIPSPMKVWILGHLVQKGRFLGFDHSRDFGCSLWKQTKGKNKNTFSVLKTVSILLQMGF